MGALTEVYLDADIGGTGGDGSSGDPYGSWDTMASSITWDSTNGMRVKVQGTVVGTDLSRGNFNPSLAAKLVIQPWGSTPVFDADGDTNSIFSFWGGNWHQKTDVIFRECEFTNGGASGSLLTFYANQHLWKCYLHDGYSGVSCINNSNEILDCRIEAFDTFGISQARYSRRNFIQDCGTGVITGSGSASVTGNIISLCDVGIYIAYYLGSEVSTNSLLGRSSGSPAGIGIDGGSSGDPLKYGVVLDSNLIADFADAIGRYINSDYLMVTNNGAYNCTEFYESGSVDQGLVDEDNDTSLASDPFARSGDNTYANRFNFFAPTSQSLGWGRGAVVAAAGGGGSLYIPGLDA